MSLGGIQKVVVIGPGSTVIDDNNLDSTTTTLSAYQILQIYKAPLSVGDMLKKDFVDAGGLGVVLRAAIADSVTWANVQDKPDIPTNPGDMKAETYDPIIKAITGESEVGATPDTTLAILWGLKWSEKYSFYNPATGFCSDILSLTRKGKLQKLQFLIKGTVSAATDINLFAGGSNSITASLTNSATSITVANAPAQTVPFYAMLNPYSSSPEIVQVTAVSETTLTITRAQCGTAAAAHNNGVVIMPVIATLNVSTFGPATYIPSSDVILDEDTIMVYNINGAGFASANISSVAKWVNA